MQNVLSVCNLTKKFAHNTGIENINLSINKGDIYGLIGKNGAGKTTLMRVILSLAFADSGTVTYFGGKPFREAARKIGSLIESPSLYKNCSAYENLKRFAILYGAEEGQIPEILELVGLKETGDKKVGKFSLGMKQRLGIAIALLGSPEFLILDEPVNGLDPEGIAEIRTLILKLNQERGITILISSHLLEELSKVVTCYGIIKEGKLVEEFSAKQLELKAKQKLYIKVDDIDKSIELLKKEYRDIVIETNENELVISDYIEESGEINRLLSKNSILVTSLQVKSNGLEQYFLEKVGGKNEESTKI